jgi:hypothetical protein
MIKAIQKSDWQSDFQGYAQSDFQNDLERYLESDFDNDLLFVR